MMEFYQTQMGRRFFDAQLPALTDSIERLAKAVEENNRLMQEMKENGNSGHPDIARAQNKETQDEVSG